MFGHELICRLKDKGLWMTKTKMQDNVFCTNRTHANKRYLVFKEILIFVFIIIPQLTLDVFKYVFFLTMKHRVLKIDCSLLIQDHSNSILLEHIFFVSESFTCISFRIYRKLWKIFVKRYISKVFNTKQWIQWNSILHVAVQLSKLLVKLLITNVLVRSFTSFIYSHQHMPPYVYVVWGRCRKLYI